MIDPPRRQAERGFTLIEAIVALAALALVLGVAFQQSRASLEAARRVEGQSLALSVAESRIAETATLRRWQAQEEEGGEPGGIAWTRRIRPAEEAGDRAVAQAVRLWVVEVSVTGPDGATLRLATMRAAEESLR